MGQTCEHRERLLDNAFRVLSGALLSRDLVRAALGTFSWILGRVPFSGATEAGGGAPLRVRTDSRDRRTISALRSRRSEK